MWHEGGVDASEAVLSCCALSRFGTEFVKNTWIKEGGGGLMDHETWCGGWGLGRHAGRTGVGGTTVIVVVRRLFLSSML